jgi:hypothetical protein
MRITRRGSAFRTGNPDIRFRTDFEEIREANAGTGLQ